jgi:hypothetical protein
MDTQTITRGERTFRIRIQDLSEFLPDGRAAISLQVAEMIAQAPVRGISRNAALIIRSENAGRFYSREYAEAAAQEAIAAAGA